MKQTAAWDLVVVGGAYTDYIVQGPKIPEQVETTLGNKFLELLGSKASNQAVALAEGRSWTEAGPFASAAAAFTTTKLGARPALPRREDMMALLAQQHLHV